MWQGKRSLSNPKEYFHQDQENKATCMKHTKAEI